MSGKRRPGRHAELPRVVLDTGALIALDEQHPVERVRGLVAAAAVAERRPDVQGGGSHGGHREECWGSAQDILEGPSHHGTADLDAIVMATAASLGAIVYSSDFDDLDRFTRFFDVRVLTI
jgi:hypothetical protein